MKKFIPIILIALLIHVNIAYSADYTKNITKILQENNINPDLYINDINTSCEPKEINEKVLFCGLYKPVYILDKNVGRISEIPYPYKFDNDPDTLHLYQENKKFQDLINRYNQAVQQEALTTDLKRELKDWKEEWKGEIYAESIGISADKKYFVTQHNNKNHIIWSFETLKPLGVVPRIFHDKPIKSVIVLSQEMPEQEEQTYLITLPPDLFTVIREFLQDKVKIIYEDNSTETVRINSLGMHTDTSIYELEQRLGELEIREG